MYRNAVIIIQFLRIYFQNMNILHRVLSLDEIRIFANASHSKISSNDARYC
jgi:hypothetical protein